MKGWTFESFQVTPGNREAFEHCHRVAAIEDLGPSLTLLLGPEGCGKSHLLWAVAKQVRLNTLPVGLALITPREFPDKVRDLVEDPRPLQGRRAILLVDNLEGFVQDARRLEAVIETFLDHQHPVLLAANVHPNRLRELSGALRARLARAHTIAVEPRPPGGAGPLENVEKIEALEARIAELEGERDALNEKLAVAFASAEDLAKETVALENRVRELAEEAEFAMAQQSRTQIALSDARLQLEETAGLRDALAERDRELAAARESVRDALARLEEMRAAHAASGDELLSNVHTLADELSAPESEAPLLQALAGAGREHEHVRAALAATRERLKRVEFEWEKTRKVLAIQTAEMDALRYNAASQVATANVQAGELEHRIDSMESALARVEASAGESARALPEGDAAARSLRDAVEQLRAQLAAIHRVRSGLETAPPAPGERSIFESDFFEALPDDFQMPVDPDHQAVLPGLEGGMDPAAACAPDGRDYAPVGEPAENTEEQER